MQEWYCVYFNVTKGEAEFSVLQIYAPETLKDFKSQVLFRGYAGMDPDLTKTST